MTDLPTKTQRARALHSCLRDFQLTRHRGELKTSHGLALLLEPAAGRGGVPLLPLLLLPSRLPMPTLSRAAAAADVVAVLPGAAAGPASLRAG
jgi:hypothetical protein